MLAIPGAFAGAVYAGNQMNHISLSPKFAGTMYGITNAAANMCGFLAPYVIGVIIQGRVSKFFDKLINVFRVHGNCYIDIKVVTVDDFLCKVL